ncbi:MAG: hypothetical protein J6J60_01150 [Clostridia bacterium]|nr:hypothetical protein [Clostridia bacterium]
MEENDISNVISKFSDILKEKDININDFVNNNSNNNTENSENCSNEKPESSGFNIDINTILKFKSITDKLNNQNNPRTSLLQALKPFLSEKKQNKLEEYIKIVNILSILDTLNKEI